MKRKNFRGKTQHLKKLIRERRLFERQEEQDKRIALEGLKIALPKKAQEKVIVESVKPQEEPLNISPKKGNEMPERLRGLSIGDILLLEADGGLSKEEEIWVMGRPWKYGRRLIPPERRWMN